MKKLAIVVLSLGLTACASVGEVMPTGVNTYTVASYGGGKFSEWSKVKALAIKRANEFCDGQNMHMTIVGWETHGVRGLSSPEAELNFRCVPDITPTSQ